MFFNTYISLYTRSWKPKIFLLKRVDSQKVFERGESGDLQTFWTGPFEQTPWSLKLEMGLRAARGARARAVCSKGPVQVFLAEGMFEIPPCQRKSFWKDRWFSWRSHGSLGANLVIIVLHDSQPWVSSHMNFPWQFPYFFTTKEFHPSVTHFASPFWWRSFRRFCPLVICTETASRFERGPKHVAHRWGIEADGFVGNANKTSKPHTEMCKTTNLFQSVLLHKCFFFFVACFCGCKRKIPTWNTISQGQEYQQKDVLKSYPSTARVSIPADSAADSVRWLGWMVPQVSHEKHSNERFHPWCTPLKTNMSPENQWLEDVFPSEVVLW